jgi:hypothetical protein
MQHPVVEIGWIARQHHHAFDGLERLQQRDVAGFVEFAPIARLRPRRRYIRRINEEQGRVSPLGRLL